MMTLLQLTMNFNDYFLLLELFISHMDGFMYYMFLVVRELSRLNHH
jgi:hypothetical protein